MSPCLLLIVREGLNRALNLASLDVRMQGIKFVMEVYVTHILFVDDILIFLGDSSDEDCESKEILNILCLCTSMKINYD